MEEKDVEVKERNSQKKNGNTVGVIFIALLLIGLSAACGWFANNYFRELSHKPEEAEKEEEKETYHITEEQAFKLFNIFLSDETESGLSPLAVQSMKNFGNMSSITLSDLDNNLKFEILKRSLNKEDVVKINSDGGRNQLGQAEISVDTLKKHSLLYFNEVIPFGDSFDYLASVCDLNNDKYVCDYIATGGELNEGWIYVPVNYKVEKNLLKVEGIAAYDGLDAYYENKNSSQKYCAGVYGEKKNSCLKQYTENFKKVTMTFDISNNKYLFVSIEK